MAVLVASNAAGDAASNRTHQAPVTVLTLWAVWVTRMRRLIVGALLRELLSWSVSRILLLALVVPRLLLLGVRILALLVAVSAVLLAVLKAALGRRAVRTRAVRLRAV